MTPNKLYNYRTRQYDGVRVPETDREAVQYIPQSERVQALYWAHRAAGLSIATAMVKVFMQEGVRNR